MGGHLCHVAEYIAATSGQSPPASGAWLDESSTTGSTTSYHGSLTAGRSAGGYNCQSWSRSNVGSFGLVLLSSGALDSGGDCATARPLACCNTPLKVRMLGFTAATTSGNSGGRHKMHAMCATAFAGSHMCHVAEYLRASAAAPVPATGAWLDESTINGSSTVYVGHTEAGRTAGGYNCRSWTSGSVGTSGTMITPTGGFDTGGDCAVSRQVACCI
jgi:hypothetical protein